MGLVIASDGQHRFFEKAPPSAFEHVTGFAANTRGGGLKAWVSRCHDVWRSDCEFPMAAFPRGGDFVGS